MATGSPVQLTAHPGSAALGRLGDLRHPLRGLLTGGLGEPGSRRPRDARGLPHGGVLGGLLAHLLHLLVTLAAHARAGDEAGGETSEERDTDPHLVPLPFMCFMTFPGSTRVVIVTRPR